MSAESDGNVTVLVVAYEGSSFHGFARQPGLASVQGRLEESLGIVLRREVETVGAGRTDAGVHALGQVVSFSSATGDPPVDVLQRSLNALAGPNIVVRSVSIAAASFDARYSAVSREYRYRIVEGDVPPLFLAGVSWWVKGYLDVDAMREGSLALLGEHDFRSFCVTESAEGKRTVRDIDVLEILGDAELGEQSLVIRVVGRSFLHSMVRVIAGTLVEVGKGRREPGWVATLLETQHRSAAGPTAPAQGLTLWSVEYPAELWPVL